jgi:DGQHR domain-containing protein
MKTIDKGEELNRRVWELFERAGFSTKPNTVDEREETITLSDGKKRTLDLLAFDKKLGIKIIGWNKARGSFSESFTVHIHDYQYLKRVAKANTVLFVMSEKEISQDDYDYVHSLGMNLWGIKELEYYEAIVDAIGNYAKYEIIHALNLTTNEEKDIYTVPALKLHQPLRDSAVDLFLFTATPEFLLKTAVILRKASLRKDAYQRILQKKRLTQIKNFVTKKNALLPTNIIVHLGDKVGCDSLPFPPKTSDGKKYHISKTDTCELVLLSIPREYASLELIDGQHRLFGFVNSDPATRESFNLIVLGISNIEETKRTETFVAINDNARRMNANLVAFLKYTEDEAICQNDNKLMAIKIVVELNKTTPFKDKIQVLDVGKQRITLKGFSGYDLIGLIGKKGQLRKYYPHDSLKYVSALRLYFNILKGIFPDQWQDPDKYIIFTNRGISAFLKLLKSILKTEKNQLDTKKLEQYFTTLKKYWKKNWETKYLKSAYVGSKGWKDFHHDLVKTIRKEYPLYE